MEKQPQHWQSVFREDPKTGDLILKLPKSFLKEHGWRIGDTVRFSDVQEGSFMLANISKQEREIGGKTP
jgi:hypothetical protein